jgi:hypothetical protein
MRAVLVKLVRPNLAAYLGRMARSGSWPDRAVVQQHHGRADRQADYRGGSDSSDRSLVIPTARVVIPSQPPLRRASGADTTIL